MTYKELLYDLAVRTGNSYNLYLNAKISTVLNPAEFSAERSEQHRAEYVSLEKKLITLLATVKNEVSPDDEAAKDLYKEFYEE